MSPGCRGRIYWVAAVAIACPCSAPDVRAQIIVEDPWNLSYNVVEYAKQIYQVAMQVQQLEAQLQDMEHLRGFPARNAELLLDQVSALLGQPQSLGYANPDVGGTFQTYFTPSQIGQPWVPVQEAQAEATLNVLQAAVVATNRQQQAIAPGEAAIAQMKRTNSGLLGQQQALELQNTAAVYSAEELMLLRQAAMLQTNLQAVYYADQIAREAQRDTTVRALLTTLAAPAVPAAAVTLSLQP
jgi:P-type conjugative transfer protein TrbJ